MRHLRCSRLTTLLLALLLAGGGSGLPLVDAVLHHLGDTAPARVRIADGEGPATHADRCTLGVAAPAMSGPAVAPALPAVSLLPVFSLASFAPRAQDSREPSGSARPRAPPVAG